MLSSARFVFASIATSLAFAHFCAMEPILAARLIEKGLTTMQIGLFFCIFPVFYILCSMSMHFISQKIEKRVRVILAFGLLFVAFLLVGPS